MINVKIPKEGYLRSMTQEQWNEFIKDYPRKPRLTGRALANYIARTEKEFGSDAPKIWLTQFADEIPELKPYFERIIKECLANE